MWGSVLRWFELHRAARRGSYSEACPTFSRNIGLIFNDSKVSWRHVKLESTAGATTLREQRLDLQSPTPPSKLQGFASSHIKCMAA